MTGSDTAALDNTMNLVTGGIFRSSARMSSMASGGQALE